MSSVGGGKWPTTRTLSKAYIAYIRKGGDRLDFELDILIFISQLAVALGEV